MQTEKYKNKEWLFNEYVTKKRTANDIAKEIGRDAKTVWSWLKKFEIKTRPRGGGSSSGSFNKGHKIWLGKKHTKETRQKIRDARIKDGHVPYLKNGKHWLHSDGAVHPLWRGGVTPERQAVYSSKDWVNAVKKVWKRDNAHCQRCKTHHNNMENRGKFHIHHIVSFQVERLRCDADNLILLCEDCHRWVHSKKNVNKYLLGDENES